ncbi:DHA2 family efflux MFS transporter permease subunit [Desulforhabdus sp. TSK]|uniref:DHA2 family efflux MFS transporter permease subunit n=1 Tax=Desulforhabdus sp. TSK TaxID=2925014 RepID=UPI001FC8EB24|nr:DHA2 family efflux MFS transporter permease subunit [Desulforhabdus sp. TSK]GKT10446.1 EmrB/QacA family drug resistance transporter [Desulforhabdus sp. TSK]
MSSLQQRSSTVNPWIIAVATILPTFMVALDTSVANVALPQIAGSLSASSEEATWVLTSYLVANAIVLPITGWMSLYFGRKRFLMASIVIFTVSSVACGAAFSLPLLILARIVQGASGGALLPVSQAVLLESFPPVQRGEAMAVYALGVIVAPIVGPTLGGWLTDNYSWRWVFYINLPVGVLAVVLTQLLIEDPPYVRGGIGGKIDYVGFILMAISLGTLQLILDKGQQDDWFSALWIRWSTGISIVSLIGFFLWEIRVKHPIVDIRILANRNFSIGIMTATLYGIILYGTLVMLPLFLQELMGYPALQSGLAITPRGMGALFSVTLAGRLVKRVDGRLMIVGGFLALAAAGFMLGRINLDISMASVVLPNIIIGAAMGFIFVPLTTIAMGSLPNERMGTATGLYNLMRNMGGSIGIAIVTTMLARAAQTHQATLVSHLTPYDPAYREWLEHLRQLFLSQGDVVTATRKAYGAMYGLLVEQSTLYAFVDNFRLLGYVAFLGIPLVFFFKKPGKPGGGGAVASD